MNEDEQDIEIEEEITFCEFKAWMNGLIYGKGNNVPDFHDWKLIKQMMERVVPDKIEMQNPAPWPVIPTPVVPYTTPNPVPDKWEITCSGDAGLTFGELSGVSYGTYGTTNFGAAEYIGSQPNNIGDPVKSTTPALDHARVLLKQFKDEAPVAKNLHDHLFDTSKYMIAPAEGKALSNIAKLQGVKK